MLKNIRFKIDIFLAKFYNYFVNNRLFMFINFNILFAIIAVLIKDLSLILFIQPLIILIVFTTYRLSNVGVYSSVFHILSMNLKDVNMFKYYDYDNEKDREIISNIFKEEFILFLKNAYIKNFKTIKMTTHKWVVNNVVLDEEIQNLYEIEVKEIGKCKSTLEVLLLAGKYTPRAYYSRIKYKVILRKKV